MRRRFTRVDGIIDLVFKAEEIEEDAEERSGKKFTFVPVQFRDACITRLQSYLGESLVKQTAAVYATPNGNLTINYLDTAGGPLSPLHLAFSAGLCLLFCRGDDGDAERRALRQAMIVENLQQLYTDVFNDWAAQAVGSALRGTPLGLPPLRPRARAADNPA